MQIYLPHKSFLSFFLTLSVPLSRYCFWGKWCFIYIFLKDFKALLYSFSFKVILKLLHIFILMGYTVYECACDSNRMNSMFCRKAHDPSNIERQTIFPKHNLCKLKAFAKNNQHETSYFYSWLKNYIHWIFKQNKKKHLIALTLSMVS